MTELNELDSTCGVSDEEFWNIQTEGESMPDFIRKPEIIVFAGPNGSGKTTITKLAKTIEPYINADDIKKVTLCSDMDAAIKADKLRNQLIEQNESFALGGHDVSEEKILSRYSKALKLIPSLLDICDVCHIYDNTDDAYRIFKKRKDEFFYWESEFWNKAQIQELVGIEL